MAENITCDTDAKWDNREVIREQIKKWFKKKNMSEIKVLCLPGHEALEIIQIWNELGVPNKNIYAATNEQYDYECLSKYDDLNVIYEDIINDKFVNKLIEICQKNGELFDVIYFDLYSNFNPKLFTRCVRLSFAIKDDGIFGMTWFLSREKQEDYKKFILHQECGASENNDSRINTMFAFVFIMTQFQILEDSSKKIDEYIKESSLFWKNLSIDDRRKIMKEGMCPKECLKTKYITDKGTPMGTIFCKFAPSRSFGSGWMGFKKIERWRQNKLTNQKILLINNKPVNKQTNIEKSIKRIKATTEICKEVENETISINKILIEFFQCLMSTRNKNKSVWKLFNMIAYSQTELENISKELTNYMTGILTETGVLDRKKKIQPILSNFPNFMFVGESNYGRIKTGAFFKGCECIIFSNSLPIQTVNINALDGVITGSEILDELFNDMYIDMCNELENREKDEFDKLFDEAVSEAGIDLQLLEEEDKKMKKRTSQKKKKIPTAVKYMMDHPNFKDKTIMNKFGLKKMQLAAYKAHITMGTYQM